MRQAPVRQQRTRYPRLHPEPRPAMASLGLDGFTKLAAKMNDIGTQAKAAGLQYAYHNHNYEFEKMPDGPFGYDVLINNTDHNLVKFEIDCGWMCAGGADPVAYFAKYPGRFKMVHIKEFQAMDNPSISLSGPTRPKGTDLDKDLSTIRGYLRPVRRRGSSTLSLSRKNPFRFRRWPRPGLPMSSCARPLNYAKFRGNTHRAGGPAGSY